MPRVDERRTIPDSELRFEFSRSSGPGGQNVNRVETRVTLRFDLVRSPSLSDADKARIAGRLATRVGRNGVLRVTSQRHRTREANRKAATERFVELLAAALRTERRRVPTRATAAARGRRIEEKRRLGGRKRERSAGGREDD